MPSVGEWVVRLERVPFGADELWVQVLEVESDGQYRHIDTKLFDGSWMISDVTRWLLGRLRTTVAAPLR